ncbi:putative 4-hydroxy-4-methyl-2-oxoglutarate aldolase [Aeromonas schubertii]|uniref:putative 4-hydroxy-4-methyl-2-oxoglutarate aldolase n=1 Tax=Aeromonas schubertii TaxID=652 RepID=UPI001CC50BB3|nr:putative 4-hydroxy-4-methyl-2-oxoglutarate aldolase [Aeromonas schubertii]MBZ6070933.1 putative 4-hydroxy-4-methyl-2-oxoglutarate aldolase [Aeromonas schubertii]
MLLRPSRDLLPDLCDNHAERLQVASIPFTDYGGHTTFFGRVVTLSCFEDNSLVRELVAQDGRGRVLVIDGQGSLRRALLGDLLAQKAVDNGWEGVVINGAVRDVVTLGTLPLGVKALGSCPIKTEKLGLGERDAVLQFAGLVIHPGDYLYADPNGVAVSADALLD